MTNSSSLSIIIPVFNEEDYIGPCLDAIAAQTRKPSEVIVVDNNSSDATLEIVARYPFVRVVCESKQGVVHARNTGFNKAKSELIGRIDADTILPADWVQTVLDIMVDKKLAAATGPVGYYDMPHTKTNHRIDHAVRKALYRGARNMPFLFGSNMVLTSGAWKEVRDSACTSKDSHEDLDLAIHLSRRAKRIRYDKSLRASMSSRRYDDSPQKFAHYMNIFRKTYTDHGIYSLGAPLAVSIYWIGYLTLYPLRRSYDPATDSRSLKNFFKKTVSRPHPM